MTNLFRIASQAASELENTIPDMVDAIETEKERKQIRAILNRLAVLVNESRNQM